MVGLLLPVGSRRMSSWYSHTRRNPRSSEPGTDWYCPIGTPVLAPADGRIYGSGESITPATGRWVGIEFDNGMSFRAMHHSRNVRTSGRVVRGEVIALSGASGYGEEDWSWNPDTGGAHVHGTLWPTWTRRFGYRSNGQPWTVDFMAYADTSATAGSGATNFEEDFMGALSDDQIRQMYDALVVNGGQYYKTDAIVNAIRDEVIEGVLRGELKPLLEAVRNGDTYFPGTNWNAYETLANVSREDAATLKAILDRSGSGGAVDVSALVDQIREGLAPDIVSELARRLAG